MSSFAEGNFRLTGPGTDARVPVAQCLSLAYLPAACQTKRNIFPETNHHSRNSSLIALTLHVDRSRGRCFGCTFLQAHQSSFLIEVCYATVVRRSLLSIELETLLLPPNARVQKDKRSQNSPILESMSHGHQDPALGMGRLWGSKTLRNPVLFRSSRRL